MPTDTQLRQIAIDTLCSQLRNKKLSGSRRAEIALAVLTEMREAIEDSPQRQLQDFVQELYLQTSVELEIERRLAKEHPC